MAPSRKRKRAVGGDGHDDDHDDAIYGLRQILPVANLPINFDGEPMDGMQYLFTVRYVLSITLFEGLDDEMAPTDGMHGGCPTSSASTIPTHVALHGLFNPLTNLPPNPPNTEKPPRRSQVKNGVANSNATFATSVV
jgi:hypothetical protein